MIYSNSPCTCGKRLVKHCANVYMCEDKENCGRIAILIQFKNVEDNKLEFYKLEKTN